MLVIVNALSIRGSLLCGGSAVGAGGMSLAPSDFVASSRASKCRCRFNVGVFGCPGPDQLKTGFTDA